MAALYNSKNQNADTGKISSGGNEVVNPKQEINANSIADLLRNN